MLIFNLINLARVINVNNFRNLFISPRNLNTITSFITRKAIQVNFIISMLDIGSIYRYISQHFSFAAKRYNIAHDSNISMFLYLFSFWTEI